MICLFAPPASAAAPPNDAFAAAEIVSGMHGSTTGTTVDASTEGEPILGSDCFCTVWYRWTAPTDGTAVFDTVGHTQTPTRLDVFTGASAGDLTRVAEASLNAYYAKSRVVLSASEGTTYSIRVYSGSSQQRGNFFLNWRLAAGPVQASNDAFSEAYVLTGAAGSAGGNTVGSTWEEGEPGSDSGDDGTVWYRWTAPASGTAAFDTFWSADYLPYFRVFTGSTVHSLVPVALTHGDRRSSDDRIEFAATAGTVYSLSVSDFRNRGALFLNWKLASAAAPANDAFANAQTLTGASGSFAGSNLGATREAGEDRLFFHTANAGYHSVWFRWTAPADGTVVFDTVGSSTDTLLAAHADMPLDWVAADYPIDWNDNVRSDMSSRISVDLPAGFTLRIVLDTYAADAGPFVLSWMFDGGPPDVACGSSDGRWHRRNVSIGCTASDAGSGLADSSQAAFTLSTQVPAGSETADAATNATTVCDLLGKCAQVGPVGGNKIDRKRPRSPTTLKSTDHRINRSSRDRRIDMYWTGATDGGSGVDGFSYSWTRQPDSVPDRRKDAGAGTHSATSARLSAGKWWFHIRTRDRAGNWTPALHRGPYVIRRA